MSLPVLYYAHNLTALAYVIKRSISVFIVLIIYNLEGFDSAISMSPGTYLRFLFQQSS